MILFCMEMKCPYTLVMSTCLLDVDLVVLIEAPWYGRYRVQNAYDSFKMQPTECGGYVTLTGANQVRQS